MAPPKPRFDEAYYREFYQGASRVQGRREVARLATIVTGIIEASQSPLETVLEIGAGTGMWRDWFARRRPDVRYRSTDVSPFACQQFGHEQRNIVTWKTRQQFDLVVCQGALPYLDDQDAAAALRNLTAMTGGFLYLEAVTSDDLARVADLQATDSAMHGRPGDWYRRRLRRSFRQVGFGLWVRRGSRGRFWELECAN